MKSRLTALLLTLALLLTALPVCAAAEETSSTRMPLYDVFPLQLDDNTVLELPIDWGYQFVELEGVPPIAYAMNDSEQLLMMVKIPADYTPNEASDRLGLTSFIPEGTAVMLGITTPQSTRLQEMTINDMPAVLVEMNGQGFDILWIGDSGDLYFLMFPQRRRRVCAAGTGSWSVSARVPSEGRAGQSRVGFRLHGGKRRSDHYRLYWDARTCADSVGNRRSAGDGAGGQGVL